MLFGLLSVVATSLTVARGAAQSVPRRDTFSDTWVATDALGRSLPTFQQAGPPRKDRFVGIFYFLWLGAFGNSGLFDITQILHQDPNAMTEPSSPLWGPLGAPHYWGQPLLGYYRTDDEFVLRKHAQMLSDAGVDVIIFDVTNNVTYKSHYMKLLEVFSKIRAAGGRTPQVAFLCPFWDPANVVRELFRDLYGPGLYKDLWFRWKGKPLILADPQVLGLHNPDSSRLQPHDLNPGTTLGQSFVAKEPFIGIGGAFGTYGSKDASVTLTLYSDSPSGRRVATQSFANVPDNRWISLAFKRTLPPGTYYLEASNPRGHVGWWTEKGPLSFGGRMFRDGKPLPGALTLNLNTATQSGVSLTGFFTYRAPQPDYFQGPVKPDMWSWLEVYPQHVFQSADGRKEQMSVGVAQNAVDGRLGSMSEPGAHGRNWHDGANDDAPGAVNRGYNFQEQAERALKEDPEFVFVTGWNEWIAGRFAEFAGVELPVMFVDEFDQEFSRDIEPMAGGHGDDYYYQFVSFVRRFKGVRPAPVPGPPKTIDVDRPFDQWKDVRPEFRNDRGDASRRDHPGWNDTLHYTNDTARNDFEVLKVSRDDQNVYFYARTRAPVTPYSDTRWMMLFLGVGDGSGPNWEGYQYVVNRSPADASTCGLEESTGGWSWQPSARVRYRAIGNEMQIAIPRSALGLADPSKPLKIDFKWVNNIQSEGDIMDFYRDGIAAPTGRFNYEFLEPARKP